MVPPPDVQLSIVQYATMTTGAPAAPSAITMMTDATDTNRNMIQDGGYTTIHVMNDDNNDANGNENNKVVNITGETVDSNQVIVDVLVGGGGSSSGTVLNSNGQHQQTHNNNNMIEIDGEWVTLPQYKHWYKITDLDKDTTMSIMLYLNKFDILKLSEANRYFYHVTSHNDIWKPFLSVRDQLFITKMVMNSAQQQQQQKQAALKKARTYDESNDYGTRCDVAAMACHDEDDVYDMETNSLLKQKMVRTDNVSLITSQIKDLFHLEQFYTPVTVVPPFMEKQYIERRMDFDVLSRKMNIRHWYSQLKHRANSRRAYKSLRTTREEQEAPPSSTGIIHYFYLFIIVGVLWVLALLYFGILFPLTIDRYIYNHPYIWLVPYLPPASFICILYFAMMGFLMRAYWTIPVFDRRRFDDGREVDITLLVSTLFLPVPVTILMYGLKVGLYFVAPNFLWSYMMIPIVISVWLVILNGALVALPVQRYNRTVYVTVVGVALSGAFLTAGIVLNALKADAILPANFLYSYVFFLYYIALFIFVLTVSLTIAGRYHGEGCWTIVLSLVSFVVAGLLTAPMVATLIVGGLKLDRVVGMPYIAVFAPFYGGIVVLIGLVVLLALIVLGIGLVCASLGLFDKDD